jgi:hypothetical protein
MVIRGVLAYLARVEFKPDPKSPLSAEDQFVAWASRKEIVLDGEILTPGDRSGLLADFTDANGCLEMPDDGIFILEPADTPLPDTPLEADERSSDDEPEDDDSDEDDSDDEETEEPAPAPPTTPAKTATPTKRTRR